MDQPVTPIQEISGITRAEFENEIVPRNQPAVFRGLVQSWPAVAAARQSDEDAIAYLTALDSQSPLYTIVGNPEIQGRFFYRDDLRDVNFQRTQASLSTVLEQLKGLRERTHPHAVAIQAASVREALPGYAEQNHLTLLDDSVEPTMWLGNAALVAPHYDVHDNIACVTMGRRRFTLFPPEQIANLYVGPTLGAPGGVPISMVDLRDPDLQRFPNFPTALDNAQQALLEPGDAIFIPSPWWHAVEALDPINILINYWWSGADTGDLSPNHSLLHGMLTIAKLSPEHRQSWRAFFDYFVFRTDSDPTAHLPDDLQDVVTSLSEEQKKAVYQFLRDHLK